MKEFYCTIDAARKNYLIISPERGGRVHVAHDSRTDEELDEVCPDYFDYNQMTALEIGEAMTIADGSQIVVRIS